MRHRPRQVCLCDPNRLLSSLPRFSAHCHARSLLPTVVNHSTIYDENPDLHHGLLEGTFYLHRYDRNKEISRKIGPKAQQALDAAESEMTYLPRVFRSSRLISPNLSIEAASHG